MPRHIRPRCADTSQWVSEGDLNPRGHKATRPSTETRTWRRLSSPVFRLSFRAWMPLTSWGSWHLLEVASRPGGEMVGETDSGGLVSRAVTPDDLERRLRERLDELGPAPPAELLDVPMLPDFERANRIGEFWGLPGEPRLRRTADRRRGGPGPSGGARRHARGEAVVAPRSSGRSHWSPR